MRQFDLHIVLEGEPDKRGYTLLLTDKASDTLRSVYTSWETLASYLQLKVGLTNEGCEILSRMLHEHNNCVVRDLFLSEEQVEELRHGSK
jgi:hypothetical protein